MTGPGAGAPPMGWYPAPKGLLRWWDGARWTGLRVKDGVPGIDWATSERPSAAWVAGIVFAVLAAGQFALGGFTPGLAVGGVPAALLAALWLGIAAQSSAVQRLPPPTGAAVVIDAVRPLPGEQEGGAAAPAGWYAVAPRTTRWWTGARWSHYLGTPYGVRPVFHGARSYRGLRVVALVTAGIGLLALIGGIVVLAVAGGRADGGLTVVIGVLTLLGGVLVAVVGILLLAMSRSYRRTLLPPSAPPAPNQR